MSLAPFRKLLTAGKPRLARTWLSRALGPNPRFSAWLAPRAAAALRELAR